MGEQHVLTKTELVVLFVAADLDGQHEAAKELGLGYRTVKNHLYNARQKFGCKSTLGLYHLLVRGVSVETTVTTRIIRED